MKINELSEKLKEVNREKNKHVTQYENIQKELEDTEKTLVSLKSDMLQSDHELRQLKERKINMLNS
jgi:hypothetical protein